MVKAAPTLWCRIRGLPPVPAIPGWNGDAWRLRSYFETAYALIGESVPVTFDQEGRPRRYGRAIIVSIIRDGDPAGTGWPCQVSLLPASQFTDTPS